MVRQKPYATPLPVAMLATALLVLAQPPAHAEGGEARDTVQATVVAVVSTLERERDVVRGDGARGHHLIDEAIAPRMDFEKAASVILGRHWRTATPEQRSRFTREFRRMLVRTYASVIVEFVDTTLAKAPEGTRAVDLLDQTIAYREGPAASRDGEATVRTHIVRAGSPPIGVDYQLHRPDGQWLVWDIVLDGVSLVMTYRSSFGSIVRTDGLEGLIDRMARKNGQAGI